MRPSPFVYNRLQFRALSVGLLLLTACGCGRGNYPEVTTVTGIVTLDGKPLEDAEITFAPKDGRASSGRTDARGQYALSYTKNIRGAVLGEHRVMIRKVIEDYSKASSRAAAAIDAKQNAFDKAAGFIPDDNATPAGNLPAIEPRLVNMTPERYSGPESVLTAVVERSRNTLDFALDSGSASSVNGAD
jgi:hypothetical protein